VIDREKESKLVVIIRTKYNFFFQKTEVKFLIFIQENFIDCLKKHIDIYQEIKIYLSVLLKSNF